MIAHVWSSGDALTLDPASGVGGLGWWVCVEARAKLNTPGKKDGVNQLWIDGRLEGQRRNLDWRRTFAHRGINAVFLEDYWNEGSPVDQARWIDNFVVSTHPIGPVVYSRNPKLLKTQYVGPGHQDSWQAEIAASDFRGDALGEPVWRSFLQTKSNQLTVNIEHGDFLGGLARSQSLTSDSLQTQS